MHKYCIDAYVFIFEAYGYVNEFSAWKATPFTVRFGALWSIMFFKWKNTECYAYLL